MICVEIAVGVLLYVYALEAAAVWALVVMLRWAVRRWKM